MSFRAAAEAVAWRSSSPVNTGMAVVYVTIAVAAVVAFLLRRQPRPEDGHDRAERRERDWYRSARK